MVGLAHSPPTVSAAEKPRKGAYILLKVQGAGVLLQQSLHPLPLIRLDDGFVGPFHHRPLFPRELLGLPVHPLTRRPALLHSPGVHLIFQNAVDSGISPIRGASQSLAIVVFLSVQPLVLAGARDLFLI